MILLGQRKPENESGTSGGATKPHMCVICIMHISHVLRTHMYVCGMHCVWVDTHECTSTCIHAHGWQQEQDVGRLPLLVPSFPPLDRASHQTRNSVSQYSWLARGHWGWGILLFPPSGAGVTSSQSHVQIFLFFNLVFSRQDFSV